jgi:hypothetical protein
MPGTFREILCEVGRTYVPAMLANAAAIAAGDSQVETKIDGKAWVQNPFPYQKKCLGWVQDSHAALSPSARDRVDGILKGTGCEALFA